MSKRDFEELINSIDSLIVGAYFKNRETNDIEEIGYNTYDLNDIIIALLNNHLYTCKDSIESLINELKELYEV